MTAAEALFQKIYPKDGVLVIGLVAQAGTNLDDLIGAIANRLEKRNYSVSTVHLSQLLADSNASTGQKQKSGNKLRRLSKCQHVLALCAAADIRKKRAANDSKRQAFIIRSLKRPEEIEALRIIYGEAFVAFGIHTPRSKRIYYLTDVQGEDTPEDVVDIDDSEPDFYGQRSRDSFELCDFFIKGIDPEYVGLERALRLLFGSVFTTPTKEEYTMFMAYGASLRSADLSRQVGAALLSSSDEIIATGCNEVPQFGGGQPWPGDSTDIRDFAQLKYDPNVKERDNLVNTFLEDLNKHLAETTGNAQLDLSHDKNVEKLLKKSGLLDITEFGRTIHGEMACLNSCLRTGADPVGSTLCCTTFPCHNCVRHLLGAGIEKVLYVEPYPKSRAKLLFESSCSFWDDDYNSETGKIRKRKTRFRIEPFIGVGPRKYLDLFAMRTMSGRRIERKTKDGSAVRETTKALHDLKWPSSPFGLKQREREAISQLASVLSSEALVAFPNVDALIGEALEVSNATKNDYWIPFKDEEGIDVVSGTLNVETTAEKAAREARTGTTTKAGKENQPPATKQSTKVSDSKKKEEPTLPETAKTD